MIFFLTDEYKIEDLPFSLFLKSYFDRCFSISVYVSHAYLLQCYRIEAVTVATVEQADEESNAKKVSQVRR